MSIQRRRWLSDRYPLSIGLGYRGQIFGGTVEGDLVSDNSTALISGMRGHLRLYLPLSRSLEVYPLVGLSRIRDQEWDTSALDLGGGIDVGFSQRLSISVRYYQSFLTDPIPTSQGDPAEVFEVLSFQLTARL